MAAPKTTIWKLDPHTRAKHEILRRYLQAWTPILTQGGFRQVLYIDGFSGPGCYEGGEEGSPVIALKAALDHKQRITGQIFFLFVEKAHERALALQETLNAIPIPENFRIKVDERTFEAAFGDLRQFYSRRGRNLPPTFAFIDPFGWTGAPFSLVEFILSQPSCEVFVTFMYEEINRFIGHPDQVANFDAFFGIGDWRDGVALSKPSERNRFLHDLYLRQLRTAAAAKYVRSFQMRNSSGLTDYYLFYATNSLLGLKKMKEAMWKVDEAGEFMFSDATDPNQMVLFSKEPRYDILAQQILARFRGMEATVGEIEEFVLSGTSFRETHYKQQVLKPLELANPPKIQVVDSRPDRRRGTYSLESIRLRFV